MQQLWTEVNKQQYTQLEEVQDKVNFLVSTMNGYNDFVSFVLRHVNTFACNTGAVQ